MHKAIQVMLDKYNCQSDQDYINALKEIFQEIALLGLWRAKFYEHAAFYGGSALRILYGLDRFSEDLDFTLLKPDSNFSLEKYNQAICYELAGFGFDVEVTTKEKNIATKIESAFIKDNTQKQLLVIEVAADIIERIHHMQTIKIKMEVDTDPPDQFSTEAKTLLLPIPFSIVSLVPADLFAGKIHALLCRNWKNRTKGRDWYDFIWYISRDIGVNLVHLQARLVQSGAWPKEKALTDSDLLELLTHKIKQIDFNQAKTDVEPFINEPANLTMWSQAFFLDITQRLQVTKGL